MTARAEVAVVSLNLADALCCADARAGMRNTSANNAAACAATGLTTRILQLDNRTLESAEKK